MANEAREYLIPAQIRTMAIQNLVSIAINEGEKTSNKLKALELIGKMSEVALFTERKELIHTTNSADIKAQLLEGLRLAFNNSRQLNDLAKRKAESLLIELEDARPMDIDSEPAEIEDETPTPYSIDDIPTPPTPDPQNSTHSNIECLHSNPHKGSPSDTLLADLTPPADEVTIPLESSTSLSIGSNPKSFKDDSEGVGGIKITVISEQDSMGTPPVNVSNEKA